METIETSSSVVVLETSPCIICGICSKPYQDPRILQCLTLSLTSYANYRVHGRIHSIVAKFTIDTGAAVSLVRQDVWSRAAKNGGGLQLVPWSGQTLVGVNGTMDNSHCKIRPWKPV